MVKIAVVGAGISGLSSAVNIQRMLPNAKVTIIADKFYQDTTTFGAGGFFRPFLYDLKADGLDQEVVKRWVRDSWEFYTSLARSPLAEESGNLLTSGIVVYYSPQDEGYTLMKELTHDFQQISEAQLKRVGLGKFKCGYSYTTVITQMKKFMPWLTKLFKEAGGIVINKKVNKLAELSSEYDLVVNCCGLNSEVTGDCTSYPVKGHLVYLQAPWMKTFFYAQGDTYLIPHEDKLIVGGTREKDNTDLTPYPADREKILQKAEELVPQLKGAKVIGEWTGLRPGRAKTRLEKEFVDCGTGHRLPVVHNYGHGGHGITIGWGCGLETARLVQEIVNSRTSKL